MMLTCEQAKNIDRQYGSPFYIVDEKTFETNYDDIVRAFSSRYEKFILAYSYKTNYIPYLCSIISRRGGWAEVVSGLEYDLAVRIGQEPSKIIFNGPVKDYEAIALALDNNSIVNLDSFYEIEHVKRYAESCPQREVRIGLRINIGLSDDSGVSHVQNSLKVGRFGFAPDAENLKKVIFSLREIKNIHINSLHGHTSTTDRSIWCYQVITQTLCGIAARFLPEMIEYINIGGGIFGCVPAAMQLANVPSFDDYAAVVTDVLNQSEWVQRQKPTLVLEPGVAMVANAVSFVTKVIGIKTIKDKLFVTVDGSAFNTKPTFHKINMPHQIIGNKPTSQKATYSVVGSTCMEKDYLLTDINDIVPAVGDFIRIDNIGAYTVVLAPPFINPAPAIVACQAGSYRLIRTRQSLEQMFANYTLQGSKFPRAKS